MSPGNDIAWPEETLENAPVALGLADLQARLLRVNTAWANLMGVSREELCRQTFFDFIHPDDIPSARSALGALLEVGYVARFEARVRHGDGQHRLLELSGRLDPQSRLIIASAQSLVAASTELARTIVTAGPTAMFAIDSAATLVLVNSRMATLFGYDEGELRGKHVTALIPERLRKGHSELIERFFRAREARNIGGGGSLVGVRRDGTEFAVEIGLAPVSTPQGEFVIGTVIDVSERERHARELAARVEELHGLQRLMSKAAELSSMLQHAGSEAEVVRLACALLPDIFGGRPGALYLQPSSRDALSRTASWRGFSGVQAFTEPECWAVRLSRPHLSTAVSPTCCAHLEGFGDAACVPMMTHGQTVGVAVFSAPPELHLADVTNSTALEDISQALSNIRLRDRLRELSIRDTLTGLFNRRYLEETAAREISRAQRDSSPISVAMIDVDHFKAFNDKYGHDVGDSVLREVAEALRAAVRVEDVVCRLGGEEFVMLLYGMTLEPARERAEALRVQVRERSAARVSVSIGLAQFGAHGTTLDELLRSADGALRRAKQRGRDRVEVVDTEVASQSSRERASG